MTTLAVEILFADDHIIVVNKPSHLLSVAGIGPEKQDCVVRRMADHFGGWVREVHRLDWETSGLLALARTPDAHRHLMKQFHTLALASLVKSVRSVFEVARLDQYFRIFDDEAAAVASF